jgi:hypothetical protein
MRFAKFFLMLGALLIFSSNAKADEIRVTAYAVFQQPNAGSNQQFIFFSTFLYELDTNQLVGAQYPPTSRTHLEERRTPTGCLSPTSTGRRSPISIRTSMRSNFCLPYPARPSCFQRLVRIRLRTLP